MDIVVFQSFIDFEVIGPGLRILAVVHNPVTIIFIALNIN